MSTTRLTLMVLSCLVCVFGRCYFQKKIPNGGYVPNPFAGIEDFGCNCGNDCIWSGVGHECKKGGGPLNPFGKDFNENKQEWTQELCFKDSDGDGRTNGEELGDPDCKWSIGTTPNTEATGHPGVCEPIDAAKCKEINASIKC